jgi:hypothetical protein
MILLRPGEVARLPHATTFCSGRLGSETLAASNNGDIPANGNYGKLALIRYGGPKLPPGNFSTQPFHIESYRWLLLLV